MPTICYLGWRRERSIPVYDFNVIADKTAPLLHQLNLRHGGEPILNKFLTHLTGIISLLYLLNIGAGFIELIPDNIPVIGNLDEAAAAILLISYLRYLGIDILSFLPGRKK